MNLFQRACNLCTFIKPPTAPSSDATSVERAAYGERPCSGLLKRILGYKLITLNWHEAAAELI